MVVAGGDVVDVGCVHGACGVVPSACPLACLSAGGWWGGGWVEAGAFVVCFCEGLFPEFVPVCWQALASVGCGPWHVCRVPGGVWVVGWLVGPGLCLVGGVVCGGLLPLDPSLTPPPGRLVCSGFWFGSSLCWVVVAVSWRVSCGLQFFSEGVGWSCGWLVLLVVFWLVCSRPGVVAEVLVGCSGSAVWLLGVFRGYGLCGWCFCRGVVLLLAVFFPLGGPTWTVGLSVTPPFPPSVHDEASQTPRFGGRTHTLKR